MQNETTSFDTIIDDLSSGKSGEQSTGSDYIETAEDGAANKPQHKDQSNFKVIYKKYKTLEDEVEKLREQLGNKETEDGVIDDEVANTKLGGYEKADILDYVLENEDARPYKNDIINTLNRFKDMTIEEAYTYAKASKKETISKTTDDFDFMSETPAKPKRLSDIKNEDDVYKMVKEGKITKDQLISWKKANNLL